MNPLDALDSIDWHRVGKTLLYHALRRAGSLLVFSGRLEKACGEKLRQLAEGINSDR